MININECFKWCLVRYLHLSDHNSRRIGKIDKNFARALDFKDIKFPVKLRDIHKNGKKKCIGTNFLVMKVRKNFQSIYQEILSKDMLIYY